MEDPGRLEFTTPGDLYYNYCWWTYQPVAPTEGKLRPLSLLHHSFEVAGLGPPAFELVRTLQAAIGPFRTVWGVKRVGATLAWEFYFYDYQRREREVSITRVLEAIRPLLRCDVRVNERLPYFMFSLDVAPAPGTGSGLRDLAEVHMYVGNPGSTVSSGIAYSITPAGATLENFYFFFDARRQLRDAAAKILCSPHVDATRVPIDWLLWPELRDCRTICVANKRRHDTVYFSGVNVDQLLHFLRRLQYPPEIVGFVEQNRSRLDHLLYDVGFDYVGRDDGIAVAKSGYYGVF